jgi:4-hydroxy-tetrahydrodipicolinate reductase
MKKIRVAVHGAAGRMGREVIRAVWLDPELEVVGAVEVAVTEDHLLLPDGSSKVFYDSDPVIVVERCQPDVLVDFSVAEAAIQVAQVALSRKVNMIIGTTGISESDIGRLGQLAEDNGVGMVVASNFALGAVLMIHLARVASSYFDYAEITEMHHSEKADAPSGTALATAREMLAAREKPFSTSVVVRETLPGTRGGQLGGIGIHSVRLPGLLAHQEVLLGATGQTLSIRHDTVSRECYMPGVILAIKKVTNHQGLIAGLDKLLGL